MASMSNLAPRRAQRTTSGSFARFARRIFVPAAGLGFALWGAAVLTGLAATGPASETTASAAYVRLPLLPTTAEIPAARPSPKTARAYASSTSKTGRIVASLPAAAKCASACDMANAPAAASARERLWSKVFAGKLDGRFAADPARAARFAEVVAKNQLASTKLADLFGATGTVLAEAPAAHRSAPITERFGIATIDPKASANLALAYADPSPAGPNGALAALSAVTPQEDGALASGPNAEDDGVLTPEEEARDADGTALSPDYEDTPDGTPVPGIRPQLERAEKVEKTEKPARAEKPAKAEKEDDEDEAPREIAKPKREREGGREQKLAYARPDNPAEERGGGAGNGLKNLFGRPKAGRGVAVYDISAAKVYMPDGSVLEAHSGIGNMADNPKYANVKMKGPTPPHTYNLKMREKRFHGVEAIRMLPVDGRNKHGRDGFLTHSYLLRGGRAESHGCVAFKDYKRFLNAFKQGKVRQLVVVPGNGGGGNVRVVKNGDSV